MLTLKKDFQATVQAIRDDLGMEEYPKAMMTTRQMELGTGTINCGFGDTDAVSQDVISHYFLTKFLEKYNASAEIENGIDAAGRPTKQVRLRYAPELSQERDENQGDSQGLSFPRM